MKGVRETFAMKAKRRQKSKHYLMEELCAFEAHLREEELALNALKSDILEFKINAH